MMYIKKILLIYFLLSIELLILTNSDIVIKSVLTSLNMFLTKIFPSLFPTMVIGLLLVKLGIYKVIIFKNLFKRLFRFNEIDDKHTVEAFKTIVTNKLEISNADDKNIIDNSIKYHDNYVILVSAKGLINENEALNLLCCTHFINPLFVIGGVGTYVFKSYKIGIIILLMLYLSNLIKAFLLRNNFNPYLESNVIKEKVNFKDIFVSIIKESMLNLLVILGIVILFNILIILIKEIFNLSNTLKVFINIILEMTSGILSIKALNINIIFKILLAYFSLSFGGLCIWFQTISMITNKKIKYLKYFIFRLF